jgi:hypothetical protein
MNIQVNDLVKLADVDLVMNVSASATLTGERWLGVNTSMPMQKSGEILFPSMSFSVLRSLLMLLPILAEIN